MCQLVHVSELRHPALDILQERQDDNGHLMTAIDADQYERAWEAESPDFCDPYAIALDASPDWNAP